MGSLCRRLCGAAIVAIALTPASASATGLPDLLTGTGHGRPFAVRPAQIIYTGDGSGVLGGFSGHGPLPRFGALKWTSWTQRQALGSGAVWLDDCMPNCAQGTFHPYSVTVRASDPRGGHFTLLVLRYHFEGKEVLDKRVIEKFGTSFQYG
jgi:hypothetical protein